MGENKEIETQYDLNAKWDACLDLGVRRFVYSSAAGAFAGLLLFHNRCVLLEYMLMYKGIAIGFGLIIGSDCLVILQYLCSKCMKLKQNQELLGFRM
ncbi:putative MICOS complex subunit Mic10 protein [Helianthus annuus]|nr:putative MICOS complex subunit Mic10 protein [Helianthus annuus]